MDAIRPFARHVVATSYDDLPDRAVAASKTFVLDSLGVGLAGARGPFVDELIAALVSGGQVGEARLWGRPGQTLAAAAAALVNAYQTHNSEFDCIHEAAVVHAVTCPLACLAGEIDRRGALPGRAFITALVLGVDVAAGLGIAAQNGMRFFRPATAGLFGAVAALGKIHGLSEDRLVAAFGLALGQVSGTMQAHREGAAMLGLQMGFSARNAVTAVDMAAHGIPGVENSLEGPFGYFRMIETEYDLGPVIDALGRDWRISEIAHKPFPSGRATHGIADAVLRLRAKHSIEAADVVSIEARVPSLTHHLVGRPIKDDMDTNYARLCASFVAARVLHKGMIDMTDFLPEQLSAPDNLELGRKIDVLVDDNPDPNALTPVAIEIHLKGGRKLTCSVETVYGAPGNPMTRAAHIEKFRGNWAFGGGQIDPSGCDNMIAMADRLEELDDVGAVTRMLSKN